ncbi:hypothetical protein BDZ91DRAFT_53037 [Kalaharituber pfeilii]|nr:hypothetical protein BDZ91DRAFT_53037 [Kalaharituber pfeilii]
MMCALACSIACASRRPCEPQTPPSPGPQRITVVIAIASKLRCVCACIRATVAVAGYHSTLLRPPPTQQRAQP